MYALLGLAAIAAVYFFVRAWAGGRRRDWIAFAIFGALALYAHNLGFAFIAGLDLWIVWTWLRPSLARVLARPEGFLKPFGSDWVHLRPVLLSHLLMTGLFAPWLAIVPSQFGQNPAVVLGAPARPGSDCSDDSHLPLRLRQPVITRLAVAAGAFL